MSKQMREQTNNEQTNNKQTNNEQTNSAVEALEAVLAKLQGMRDNVVRHGTELSDERANVALAAMTGDAKARKRLDAINAELATQHGELESIDAALRTAGERLADAQRDAAAEIERNKAIAMREVLAEFAECAVSLDEALIALGEEGDALRVTIRKLRELGCDFPTDAQISVLGLQCVQTALMQTPWKREFPHLAPKDRRTFGALCGEWRARIESSYIAPRLGGETKENDDAA